MAAQQTQLSLDIPAPPDFAAALAAQNQSTSFTRGINPLVADGQGFHPICFCCGADVKKDDGVHVYTAPVEGSNGVAGEVITECRARVGPDLPIILRWSQWKQQDFGARLAETPHEL